MKNIFNGHTIMVLFITVAVFFSACEDLDFQERFEFDPEVPELTPYENITAWEFLELDPTGEFDTLKQVIQLAGLESLYSSTSTNYTYLLLKDEVFKEELIEALTGAEDGDLTEVDPARLQHLLRYHTLETYVDQGPELLKEMNVDYIFQSLVPGDTGRVSIRRNVWLQFQFNISPLVGVTKKPIRNQVATNYVFSNGIAHIFNNQYMRAVPF